MKRLDDNKVSLVDFLRSIKYARRPASATHTDQPEHFAELRPQARTRGKRTREERSLVRSNN